MQQTNEAPRQDKCWRILREGEISPYKIVTVIFIRESYIHVELRRGSPEERCATVRLIHDLITCHDMSFPDFKAVIEDSKNAVRHEILKRFNKVLQNLEEVNASFLYELVHSVIDVEATQTNILRKRITKSSPFGKFLRIVLLNLRKMSYPQALYLYQQLCAYLHPTIEFKKPCWLGKSVHPSVPDTTKIKTENVVVIKKEVEDYQENIPVTPQSASTTSSGKVTETPKPAPSAKAKGDKRRRKGLDIFFNLSQNRKKNNALGLSMNIHSQFQYERQKYHGVLTTDGEEESSEDLRKKAERVAKALEGVKSLREAWKPTKPRFPIKDISSILEISPETSFQPKRQRHRSTPKKINKVQSPKKQSKSLSSEIVMIQVDDSDYFISDTESSSDKEVTLTPTKRGTRSSSSASTSSAVKTSRTSEKERKSTELKRKISTIELSADVSSAKAKEFDEVFNVPGSKRWEKVKYWSRKQIEKTLKLLAADLFHCRGRFYSPMEISTFIEAVKYNPSAQVVHPQLYYLEYLNSLRLKDITRCVESLRTSFDLRIKPNTFDLHRGTPYAAYNCAIFNRVLGFNDDALMFLEEAFQSGHSAADATCLHYCHNLWSIFHGKPYMDAVLNATKDGDPNHMAYLHSLNSVANACEYQFLGARPEEIIDRLWRYNPYGEIEEVESTLLLCMGSFFSMFGWHDLIPFACQCILYSQLRWPTRVFVGALCLMAQAALMEGNSELAKTIMNYGEKRFGFEASPAGQLFGRHSGLFQAQVAYLGHKPVPKDILHYIAAYDRAESLFWRAYSEMILNNSEEAEKLLKRIDDKDFITSHDRKELKLRCLFLHAELRCLNNKPTMALHFLFEALELARHLYSDRYISMCFIDIASIQCALGLAKNAERTLYLDLRARSRSACPLLQAKSHLVTFKLRLASPEPLSATCHKQYMMLLDECRALFEKWDNWYRIKQIEYYRSKFHERLGRMDLDPKDSNGEKEVVGFSHLTFNPTTCIL